MLTTTQTTEYNRYNKIIERTKGSFIECGKALAAVRDGKLYKEHFDSFEQYCWDKWGWGRQYAYNLIEAATVVKELTDQNVNHGIQNVPGNERAARALGAVPEADRIETMKRAGRSATATQITNAARTVGGTQDKTGYPVPEKAQPCWNRTHEANEILRAISHVRALVKAISPDDVMYAEVNIQGIMMRISQLYTEFSPAVPYAVCTTCQGIAPETCTFCKGRGVISKHRYDTCVPEELKSMRN